MIQISQKNKHKTKLGKKKGGLFSAYQFWIVDDCRLCEIQKQGNYFWVRESLCEIESKFIGFYLCLYQVISHSFFFFFLNFLFIWDTYTPQTVSESLTEINNKQKKNLVLIMFSCLRLSQL